VSDFCHCGTSYVALIPSYVQMMKSSRRRRFCDPLAISLSRRAASLRIRFVRFAIIFVTHAEGFVIEQRDERNYTFVPVKCKDSEKVQICESVICHLVRFC